VRLFGTRFEGCLVALAEKREQFLGRTEPQFVAGIHFFDPSFEQALFRFCFGSKSNYESGSHNSARVRERRNRGVAVSVSFWSKFGAERSTQGIGGRPLVSPLAFCWERGVIPA
jgi:hypothetical protein